MRIAFRNNKLVYDPEVKVSHGLWVCPECDAEFYGGGKAMHNKGCSIPGYVGLEFHFSDAHVAEAKRKAALYGEDTEWYGISISLLREKFPELLEGETDDDSPE